MRFLIPLTLLSPLAMAQTSGFTEPPAILYGKVIHVDAGSTYQVNDGVIAVTLTNANSATNSVTLEANLAPTGTNGQFSYRLEVPQRYLPSATRQDNDLAVSATPTKFNFDTITIDGIDAQALDSSQSLFSTSFSNRAQEHRLDLKVTLPQLDSDGDDMPDWWEDANGLNKLFAGDATSDVDLDGWNALAEFINGSDPNLSNNAAQVLTSEIWLAPFGVSGLYFQVLDASDTPANITFNVVSVPAGFALSKHQYSSVMATTSFTYQDVLDGLVNINSTGNWTESNPVINLTVSDTEGSNTPVAVKLKELSPKTLDVAQPALWFSVKSPSFINGTDVQAGGAVTAYGTFNSFSAWKDQSEFNRDAFQPLVPNRPLHIGAGGSLFIENRYLYVNDTGLDLSKMTMLAQFGPSSVHTHQAEGTVLSLNGFKISLNSVHDPLAPHALKFERNGSTTWGPPVPPGGYNVQTSFRADGPNAVATTFGGDNGFLTSQMTSASKSHSKTMPTVFPTIGGYHALTDTTGSQNSGSYIRELLIYDELLDMKTLARLEDIQKNQYLTQRLWDMGHISSPITLNGGPWVYNVMRGGWASDTLVGGNLPDILSGGPADDRLTGNDSDDRFQFFKGDGNDTITDYVSTSDQIDLRGVLDGKTGTPDQYLNLRTAIAFVPGQVPTVNTILEIDYDADGGAPDMQITLEGVQLTNADLPRLVGEQRIDTGAIRYAMDVNLAAAETNLTETEYARTITLTRSGNTVPAADVYLAFTGSADVDKDYSIANATANGVIRKVSFAAGETSKEINLTPIQDVFTESEDIKVVVLPSRSTPDLSTGALSLNLEDAPQVTISSIVGQAQRLGNVPGVIQVSRTGELTQPLNVKLALDGSAINGDDYVQVAPLVSFAANEQTKTINITPADHAYDNGANKIATATVVPDTTKYATFSPWSASVTLLDKYTGSITSYAEWRAGLAAEFNVEGLTAGDADFIDLPFEYALGLDATTKQSASLAQPKSYILNGRFYIEIPSRASMGDIRLTPQELVNNAWVDNTNYFAHSLYSLAGDQIMHVFESRQAVGAVNSTGIFRVNFEPTVAESSQTNVNTLLGSTQQNFLNKGQTNGWIPSLSGVGLNAAARSSGETSILSTSAAATATVSFDWASFAGSGATVTFKVDGATVATVTDGAAAATVNHVLTGTGAHSLEWIITYGTPTDVTLQNHAELKNLSITP